MCSCGNTGRDRLMSQTSYTGFEAPGVLAPYSPLASGERSRIPDLPEDRRQALQHVS